MPALSFQPSFYSPVNEAEVTTVKERLNESKVNFSFHILSFKALPSSPRGPRSFFTTSYTRSLGEEVRLKDDYNLIIVLVPRPNPANGWTSPRAVLSLREERQGSSTSIGWERVEEQ